MHISEIRRIERMERIIRLVLAMNLKLGKGNVSRYGIETSNSVQSSNI